MPLDVTWATIGKLIFAGVVTYVIAPVLLVLRDWVLRKILEKFVLTESLRKMITEYTWKEHLYRSEYSAPSGGGYRDGGEYFHVNGVEVSEIEYAKYSATQHSLISCFVSRICGQVAVPAACQVHDTRRFL
jgi:hypothetical protein